jgi:hypothetical protein
MEQARAAVEVFAGLIPGQPIDEFTRQWYITSAQWQEGREKDKNLPEDWYGPYSENTILSDTQGQAMAYAQTLMLMPHKVNWVHVNWIWF